MGQAIEYRKLMIEMVYINLPGPQAPQPSMSGGELLHGFLAELQRTANAETQDYVDKLCLKWNVQYRQNRFG